MTEPKEPWKLTKEEYINHMITQPDKPYTLFIGTKENHYETTFEQALKDKKITKKYYNQHRYGGLKREQHIKMIAMAKHRESIQETIKQNQPIPNHILIDYPEHNRNQHNRNQ